MRMSTSWKRSVADRQRIAKLVNARKCAEAVRAWRRLPDDVRFDADRVTPLRLAVQYCSRGGRVVKVAGRWQPVSLRGRVLTAPHTNADRMGYATRAGALEALSALVRK